MLAVLFWLALIAISLPCALPQWYDSFGSPYYAYLPYAMLLVLGLIAARCKPSFRIPKTAGVWLLIVWGLISLFIGYYSQADWFGTLAFCLFTIALLSTMDTRETASRFLKPLRGTMPGLWPLVLLLLPLPGDIDTALIAKLHQFIGGLASLLLDYFSVPHLWDLSGLKLEQLQFQNVDLFPALISPLVCSFLMVVIQCLRNRPSWLMPFYFAVGLLACVFANTIWTTILAVIQTRYGLNLSVSGYGWGVIALVVTILLFFMISLDRFLLVTFFPTRQDEFELGKNPLISGWNSLWYINSVESQPTSPINTSAM